MTVLLNTIAELLSEVMFHHELGFLIRILFNFEISGHLLY